MSLAVTITTLLYTMYAATVKSVHIQHIVRLLLVKFERDMRTLKQQCILMIIWISSMQSYSSFHLGNSADCRSLLAARHTSACPATGCHYYPLHDHVGADQSKLVLMHGSQRCTGVWDSQATL